MNWKDRFFLDREEEPKEKTPVEDSAFSEYFELRQMELREGKPDVQS